MVYIIGLTGNIGTGKTTVARLLEELGAEVVDADRVAHDVMAPGTPEWERLVERFGRNVLLADGSIDRRALGAVVFSDAAALRDLEQIVHPGVRRRLRARMAATTRPVLVLEAIKLLEAGLYLEVDAVWVVVADRETQLQRLRATRGLSAGEAATRVDVQAPQVEKVARADVVIENHGDLADTAAQVRAAWQAILDGTARSRRGQVR
jgi:dephospho-CoA kinase